MVVVFEGTIPFEQVISSKAKICWNWFKIFDWNIILVRKSVLQLIKKISFQSINITSFFAIKIKDNNGTHKKIMKSAWEFTWFGTQALRPSEVSKIYFILIYVTRRLQHTIHRKYP